MVEFSSRFFNEDLVKDTIVNDLDAMRFHYTYRTIETEDCFDKHLEKVLKGFEVDKYDTDFSRYSYFLSPWVVYKLDPFFNGDDKTVSFYESQIKKDKGIRSTMKIGRFLRKYCLEMSDEKLELAVNIICEESSEGTYEVRFARTREEFKQAYTMLPEAGGYLSEYKCINASCMRHVWDIHPAECYATGDFELCYLVSSKDKIASRAIVCTKTNRYLPIYASKEGSGKALKRVLEETYPNIKDAEDEYNNGNFPLGGAKVLAITVDIVEEYSEYITPYVDVSPYVNLEGEYFVFCEGGDYSLDDADMVLNIRKERFCCVCSGSSLHLDIGGNEVCEACGVWCYWSCEYTLEETATVIHPSGLSYQIKKSKLSEACRLFKGYPVIKLLFSLEETKRLEADCKNVFGEDYKYEGPELEEI